MKIVLANELKLKLTPIFGVTIGEIEECFANRNGNTENEKENVSIDNAFNENSINKEKSFVGETNRGRSLGITYRLTNKISHILQLPDRVVTMEQEGNFCEILDVDSSHFPYGAGAHQATLEATHEEKLQPISNDFCFSTGQPIDRFYIDQFLNQHRNEIRGRVLEVADNNYTKRFGDNRVETTEILHVEANEHATVVGNLATGEGIPEDAFDCIILTQTLPFIFDTTTAIRNCHRALKRNGVLLCTVNGISQISRYDMERWGDFWRFTDLSLRTSLSTVFVPESVSICTFGNVLSATKFLMGVPAQELSLNELNYQDRDYQVLIGGKALKQ